MTQNIKETFKEIKEVVFGNHNVELERYAHELSNRSKLCFDDIKNIFNDMYLYKIDEDNASLNLAKNKIWTNNEDNLLNTYVDLATNEVINGKKNTKDKIFKDLEEILSERTSYSISFRYYEMRRKLNKSKNKKSNDIDISDIDISNFSNFDENDVDLITLAENDAKLAKEEKKENINNNDNNNDNKEDDLLDIVVNLVENIETVGIDINGLFKNLLLMSQRAVENSNVEKIDELEGKIEFLNKELEDEKDKNESLQREVSNIISEFEKLKAEVYYFDMLDGKQKLQQLNNFNKNLKYIVDKFGGVISVGA